MTTTPEFRTESTEELSLSETKLMELRAVAAFRETEEKSEAVANKGEDIINTICEAGQYNTYREVEAVAYQATWNLYCACNRIIENNADEVEVDQLRSAQRAATMVEAAMNLIKETL